MKLYCGRDFEDNVLAGPVRTFARDAGSAGLIDEWFFIRYADPEPHIRLRLRSAADSRHNELLSAAASWSARLIDDDLCTRITFDTYERELERYGGRDGLKAVESIFAADSHLVLELIQQRLSGDPTRHRALLSALTADDLLAALGCSRELRLECYRAFAPRDAGGALYRSYGAALRRALVQGLNEALDGNRDVIRVLEERRRRVEPIGQRLFALERTHQLTQPLSAICGSLVHLHLNRLFGVSRAEEIDIVGLLRRVHYGVMIGRGAGGYEASSI